MSTGQGWSGLPQNPFPFVALGWGQPQRDLQEIWRAEVQQQPVLRLNPCEITGNAAATPPAGSPCFLGPPSQTCATQTPLDFLLQLPRALGQVCVQRHDEAGQFCRSPVSFAGGLEEAGDHPGSSDRQMWVPVFRLVGCKSSFQVSLCPCSLPLPAIFPS